MKMSCVGLFIEVETMTVEVAHSYIMTADGFYNPQVTKYLSLFENASK